MKDQSNLSQLEKVALRIREMREIMGYSPSKMAELTEISEELYSSYESGSIDLPFTFIHKCAKAFGMEIIDILEGHSAKLSGYTVTRKGEGLITAAEDGIIIQALASQFRKKLATPYWVTYRYSKELQTQPISTVTHSGQEFDMVVKGSLRFRVGDREEILREGDSIFFKSSTPHGMIAIDGEDCVFLSVVMSSDATDQPMYIGVDAQKSEKENLLCEKFIHAEEDENGIFKGISFTNEDEYNFAFDTVDEIARKDPDKLAMIHVANDLTERRFTYKDIKDASSQSANYFKSLGIKRGDRVLLVLKRHYQFWFAILGLHKIGAIAIPATNQLVEHDFTYRFKAAGVSAILCTADGDTAHQVELAEQVSEMSLTKILVGGQREGWRDFDVVVAYALYFGNYRLS